MRRRKQRVVWLPPEPTNSIGAVPETGWGNIPLFQISGQDPTTNVEVPLVIDAPVDPATSTLSDVESSGYRLRRIVGKIFVFGDTLDVLSGIALIGVTAGLIVRRVDAAGVSLAAQTGNNQSACNPSNLENWTDPWIWRRSWTLVNPNFFTGVDPDLGFTGAHWNNVSLSGNSDGPHVDQKTARIVGPEERLFLDISMTTLLGTDDPQNDEPYEAQVFYDLRVLGSMMVSTGNRRNASR